MSDVESGDFDMSQLLAQAQQMQTQLRQAQENVAEQIVEGVAGGGAVRISVSGDYGFRNVTIDPSATDDHEMLEDLILAALRDAVSNVQELSHEAMGGFNGLLG